MLLCLEELVPVGTLPHEIILLCAFLGGLEDCLGREEGLMLLLLSPVLVAASGEPIRYHIERSRHFCFLALRISFHLFVELTDLANERVTKGLFDDATGVLGCFGLSLLEFECLFKIVNLFLLCLFSGSKVAFILLQSLLHCIFESFHRGSPCLQISATVKEKRVAREPLGLFKMRDCRALVAHSLRGLVKLVQFYGAVGVEPVFAPETEEITMAGRDSCIAKGVSVVCL